MKQKKIIGVGVCCIVLILVATWYFINNSSQISEGKFGIYLLENNEVVISDLDIISYNKTSQVMKLTDEGADKIQNLNVGTGGQSFVIKLDGREMYNGSFWQGFSSLSYSGVVIMVDFASINNSISIELGYPSTGIYHEEYPINNSEIFDYFESIGKLIE